MLTADLADSLTLQIDIDGGRKAVDDVVLQINRLQRYGHLRAVAYSVSPSRSPNHYHITIKLRRPLPIMERVALQAILGSDRTRELLNYCRVKNNAPYPILFIEEMK